MSKSKRRTPLTKEARMRGVRSKKERAIFNKYLKAVTSLGSKKAQQLRDMIKDAEETLERGTMDKCSPLFEGGVRVGSTRRLLPILHADKARLLTQLEAWRAQLHEMSVPKDQDLRAKFLEILPGFASRNNHSRDILIMTGVPVADLDEAGILE